MERLRCGVIFLDDFLGHLADRAVERAADSRVTTLEYIKCADGRAAGQQWGRLGWTTPKGLPDECLFEVDGLTVCMSPQTQQGLRDKWVDFKDGKVIVG